MSAFLGPLQTITTFAPSILPILFFFSRMSITNLSLGPNSVVFSYDETQEGYHCYDPVSHHLHISCNVIFWEHHSFVELSHFCTFLSTSSVLDLFPDEPHIPSIVALDPHIDFSVKLPDIFDTSTGSPSNEQEEDEQVKDEQPNPELGSLCSYSA